jgi:hypothetical protein
MSRRFTAAMMFVTGFLLVGRCLEIQATENASEGKSVNLKSQHDCPESLVQVDFRLKIPEGYSRGPETPQ